MFLETALSFVFLGVLCWVGAEALNRRAQRKRWYRIKRFDRLDRYRCFDGDDNSGKAA